MAYTKTVWENGDVITKEKLNNIENGISSVAPAIFEIQYTNDSMGMTINAIFQEIKDAFDSNRPIYGVLKTTQGGSSDDYIIYTIMFFTIVGLGYYQSNSDGTLTNCTVATVNWYGLDDSNQSNNFITFHANDGNSYPLYHFPD